MAENGDVPKAQRISEWLREMRDAAGLTRRAVSIPLGVTERAIQNWEDPEMPALPPADTFLALVARYKAQRKLLVLLGNWELRGGGEGGAGRRSKAGGE